MFEVIRKSTGEVIGKGQPSPHKYANEGDVRIHLYSDDYDGSYYTVSSQIFLEQYEVGKSLDCTDKGE